MRSLEETCARRIVCALGDGESLVQVESAPGFVVEGLWARCAESDRLCDAAVSGLCGGELESLELGRVPLGVTERGLTRGVSQLPAKCRRVRVGWPSHFTGRATEWLVRAAHARGERAALQRVEVRAAGLGGTQGGVVPFAWAGAFHQHPDATEDGSRQKSGLLGRCRKAAQADWASLEGVTDGEMKSLLRAVGSEALEALCIAGAREAEGRFADALAACAPELVELRFRDAPGVSDAAAAALVAAVQESIATVDLSWTGAATATARALAAAPNLSRLNVDGCELDDFAIDLLCRRCEGLRELSARKCPNLTAGALWVAVATRCLKLERLRCDLNRRRQPLGRSTEDEHLDERRRVVRELLASSPLPQGSLERRDLEESLASSLEDDAVADLPPFDAPFRGRALASLRATFVGFSRASTAQAWLSALAMVVPPGLREFEARGSWGGDEPEPPPPATRDAVEILLARGVEDLSVGLDRPTALPSPHALTALNLSCRGLSASHLRAIFSATTLRAASLASDAPRQPDVPLVEISGPRLETLRLQGVGLDTLRLLDCGSLATLAIRRCFVATLCCLKAASALVEVSILSSRLKDLDHPPSTIRRLALPRDALAAALLHESTLRSLTVDERDSSQATQPPVPGATVGAVFLARAAAKSAYLGDDVARLGCGIVALELLGVRDFAVKHLAALSTACPALRRLRLVSCKGLRGRLPPTTTSSSANSLAQKDEGAQQQHLFEMEDEWEPSPRRRSREQRFDPVLQCHVGGDNGSPAARVRKDAREYRRYAKLASLLPRDAKRGPACARHLLGVCGRRDCEFPHLSPRLLKPSTEKKLAPLFDLIVDVDDFRRGSRGPQSWPPPSSGRLASPRRAVLSSDNDSSDAPDDDDDPAANDDDDAGPPLAFPCLEALELEACDGLEAATLDLPRLLALCAHRCDRILTLDARAPSLTHLDLSSCASLRSLPLRPGSFVKVKVASLAGTAIPDTFLHKFVDRCRFLSHLDIHDLKPSKSKKSSSSSSSSSSARHARHSDPHRARRKTTTALEKLKAGRPDLEIVRTRKDHDSPANIRRTTLDLALA
ncbi:hypothetical protein CTAYLR_000114 [Chrysophaeum taylorii]|uniref:Uncharacterized protein n=1 Tax=Chrysophaeum taylorii TaxID=2483200 RepID=A0AAD7UGK6_9STRA|nr:hypothetical protein CTAYLR_000114 [Chrysophaeum taylorii]